MWRTALERARSAVCAASGRSILNDVCAPRVARPLSSLFTVQAAADDAGVAWTGSVAQEMLDWSNTKSDFDSLKPLTGWLQQSHITIDGKAPNFSGDAVVDGEITTLHAKDFEGKWVVLFFYPKDFTFVCPTEIIAFSDHVKEFKQRGAEVIGASCDSAEVHLAWIRTPRKKGGLGHMQIPLLADVDRRIAAAYGTLNADNFPNRGIYLIDPQGKLKSMQILQNDVGRSVDEALRLLDAYQYVEKNGVVCPANWKPGGETMEADPDGSLKYFSQAESSQDEHAFGETLTAITSRAQYEEVTGGSGAAVVDFMAGWCGKCRMLAPTVEALQKDHPGVAFYKFDVSDPALEGLAAELDVTALPHFKLFKGGREQEGAVVGYKKKPLQDAVAALAA